MPVSTSGRIVIDIDPETKAALHSALKNDGLSLKEWFLNHVESYLENNIQLSLELEETIPSRRMDT